MGIAFKRPWIKAAFCALAFFLFIFALLWADILSPFSDPLCHYELVRKSVSPDGTKEAREYLWNCWATSDFANYVSVRAVDAWSDGFDSNEACSVSDGNHGTAFGDLEFLWLSSGKLRIVYPKNARIFRSTCDM